jgi:hypothetical protein
VERLDLIRATHSIDRQLAELAATVSDDQLKGDVLAFQTKWRELSYLVTADLCGAVAGVAPRANGRRGRPRKARVVDGERASQSEES